MSVEDDFFKNANFHSYISMELRCAPGGSLSNSFDLFAIPWPTTSASSLTNDRENFVVTKTEDIDYDLSNGTFTFRATGDYFIFIKTNIWGINNNGLSQIQIYRNDVLTMETSYFRGGAQFLGGPSEGVAHTILQLKKGDVIRPRIEETNTLRPVGFGGHVFVAIKINGAYANSNIGVDPSLGTPAHYYDSDYGAAYNSITLDASGVSLYDTGDITFPEQGDIDPGFRPLTFITTTKDVTYTPNNGFFAPSEDRFFAMLSTTYLDIGSGASSDDIENEITIKNASNSSVVTISPRYKLPSGSMDPQQTTTVYFGEVSGSQNEKVDPFMDDDSGDDRDFAILRGTSFSMIDFSNNGTNPSNYISFELDSDTDNDDDITGTGFVLFNTASHNDNVQRNHIQQGQGITFTPNGGLFTVSEAGDYFVMAGLTLDHASSDTQERASSATGDNGGQIAFNKNTNVVDSYIDHATAGLSAKKPVTLYSNHFFVTGSYQPDSQVCCFIAPFEAGDFMSITVNNIGGDTKISEGSTIAMVKIDGIGGSREINPEGQHFIMTAQNTEYNDQTVNEAGGYYRGNRTTPTASAIIGGDHTINHDIEAQKDRIKGFNVPVSNTIKGPRNIRGRRVAYNVTSGGKK